MNTNNVLLLKLIMKEESFSPLIERGLTFSQISMMIKQQEEEGNVLTLPDGIHVTEKGFKAFNADSYKLELNKKAKWIKRHKSKYRKPLNRSAIVLPENIAIKHSDSDDVCF